MSDRSYTYNCYGVDDEPDEPQENSDTRLEYLENKVAFLEQREMALTEGLRQVRDVVLPAPAERKRVVFNTDGNQRACQSLRDALDAEPPTPEEEAAYQSMMAGLRGKEFPDIANPTIHTIVTRYLLEHKYDGLYNDELECGCSLDDFQPCCSFCENCQAGYRLVCGCFGEQRGTACAEHGDGYE